jgi:multidrug efflux pump
MNISRPFILRPIATSLLMVAILITGLMAYHQLPVSALPEVDYPTIQVLTFYPGAGSDVMESAVTAPLERQLGEVPGLTEMESRSSNGASVITLQFTLSESIDVAEEDVQAAINAATTYLPTDLPNPPIYNKVNPADSPVLTLALTSKTIPLADIENLADTSLAQKLSQVPGVGAVSISGGNRPAIRIRANPTALSSSSLSLEDLRNAVTNATVNRPKGSFSGEHQEYTVGANDQILKSPDYQNIVVAYRNGAPVLLSQVAVAEDGAENEDQGAWFNDTPAVVLDVRRQPGANIISVVDQIQKILPRLRSNFPAAVKVSILSDRTETIRASVKDVQFEMMATVALVVMVIFLFLRSVAATIIPSVTVPLSIVGTFGFMYLLGYSLNNLTLMALTISTGFVVDDAIVMIENISRFLEAGDKPLEAALKGAKQIGFTVVSLTISLIAVLIPLLFMGDIVGRLFREFAITLALAILISAGISLTLTPMMCATLLRHKPEAEQSWFYRKTEKIFERTISFYIRTLEWVLRHQIGALIVAFGTLCLAILLYVIVPKGFFPIQDTGSILGISQAVPDVSFRSMSSQQQKLAAVVLRDPAVQGLSSFVGVNGSNPSLNSGRMLITLKPTEQRHATVREVIERLRPELARIQGISLALQPVQDLTVDNRISATQYEFSLGDPDQAELSHWTEKLVKALQSDKLLTDVSADLQDDGRRVELDIDRVTAGRLGITPAMIDSVLYDAFGQRQITTIYTAQNQYRVVLDAASEFRSDPAALQHIYLPSNTGGQVPLNAFTKLKVTRAPLFVEHEGQFPSVTVAFDVQPDKSLGNAVEAIRKAADRIGMPASVQLQFEGSARAFEASLANEPILILAALVAVYLVLGVLYESYIHPVTILSTLPSAGIGAVFALLVTHMEFDIIALIGVVLLIGIVKKNAIMMIDFALEAEHVEKHTPQEAIVQACRLRFRPILMTTMAALLGAVPLALGHGSGSELRHPLGITIIGGLLVSQVLTLYTTPVIYLWFDRLATRFSRKGSEFIQPGALPSESAW